MTSWLFQNFYVGGISLFLCGKEIFMAPDVYRTKEIRTKEIL